MPSQHMTLSSPKGPLAEVASRFLPHFFRGRVVHGYGRGGKKLNCPTGMEFIIFVTNIIVTIIANLESSTVTSLPNDFPNGVYAGFARVEKTDLQPMVIAFLPPLFDLICFYCKSIIINTC